MDMGHPRILASLLILLCLANQALAQPTYVPHEDPSKVKEALSPLWLLTWYGDILALMIAENYTGVSTLLGRLNLTYLPSNLRYIVERFNELLALLAEKLNQTDALLTQAASLLKHYRLEEARSRIVEASIALGRANITITELSDALDELSSRLGVFQTPQGSSLRKAYQKLKSLTLKLKELWTLYLSLLRSLANEITSITGESIEVTAPQGGEIMPAGNQTIPKPLKPTSITLQLNQTEAYVGETVEAYGVLTSEEKALPNRTVIVFLGDTVESTAKTDYKGVFRAILRIPYVYVTDLPVKAAFIPKADDIGVYKPCESMPITLHILFYRVRLEVQHPSTAYPGKTFSILGTAITENGKGIDGLEVKASLAGLTASATTRRDGSFNLTLNVRPNTATGIYELIVETEPLGVYAPARYNASIQIVRARLNLMVEAPTLVILPGRLTVRGRVSSELGSGSTSRIYLNLAGVVNSTKSGINGSFKCDLCLSSLDVFTGSYELTVRAEPEEPWNMETTYKTKILVLNPVNLALALIASILTFIVALKSLRGPEKPERIKPIPEKQAPIRVEPITPTPLREKIQSPVLSCYLKAIHTIQLRLNLTPKPSETLREFLYRIQPDLGDLSESFKELTLMAEAALYSPIEPTNAMVVKAEKLASTIVEGLA